MTNLTSCFNESVRGVETNEFLFDGQARVKSQQNARRFRGIACEMECGERERQDNRQRDLHGERLLSNPLARARLIDGIRGDDHDANRPAKQNILRKVIAEVHPPNADKERNHNGEHPPQTRFQLRREIAPERHRALRVTAGNAVTRSLERRV